MTADTPIITSLHLALDQHPLHFVKKRKNPEKTTQQTTLNGVLQLSYNSYVFFSFSQCESEIDHPFPVEVVTCFAGIQEQRQKVD